MPANLSDADHPSREAPPVTQASANLFARKKTNNASKGIIGFFILTIGLTIGYFLLRVALFASCKAFKARLRVLMFGLFILRRAEATSIRSAMFRYLTFMVIFISILITKSKYTRGCLFCKLKKVI